MSNEDDIFLTTFNKMIEQLNELNSNIVAIKKSVEVIVPSIDGLGAGLTNINSQLIDLTKKFDTLSTNLSKSQTTKVSTPVAKEKPSKKEQVTKKEQPPAKVPQQASEPSIQPSHTGSPKHPIFIDLHQKMNEVTNFKQVGETLIEALEQIETNFSFSRVFYEIRRIGNSYIRKGEKDFPPKEKIELAEKIVDWEARLSE
ncbi:MAG: hypothetical protein ACTSQK_01020 [Candidatus Heimdallarchaeota archaeon]